MKLKQLSWVTLGLAVGFAMLQQSCGTREQTESKSEQATGGAPVIGDFMDSALQQQLIKGAAPQESDGSQLADISPAARQRWEQMLGQRIAGISVYSELRAFIPMGNRDRQAGDAALLTAVRSVEKWKELKDTDGNALYASAVLSSGPTTNVRDAAAPKGEDRQVKVKMKMIGASECTVLHHVAPTSTAVEVVTANLDAVKALGMTAVKPYGSVGFVAYFPVEKGWLVYSLTAIKLEGLASSAESPESIGKKNMGGLQLIAKSLAR